MARGWSYFGQFICVFLTLAAIVAVPEVNADHDDDDDDDRDSSKCPKGFANFGDSRSDTGDALYAFPYVLDPENSPYGETFFGKPAKRFSNGRLPPDFFCLAFRKRLLDPYFATTAFDYTDGINLAEAGAAANTNITSSSPFPLLLQFNQFRRFLANVADTKSQNSCDDDTVPSGNSYPKWLYTISIGGNDLLESVRANTPPATIFSSVIPSAVAAVSATIQGLYSLGARKFLIFGLPAEGCSTIAITTFGSTSPTDGMGCVVLVNQFAQAYNARLILAIQGLRTSLSGSSIAYFDYYSANIEILTNPGSYGFNPTLTKTACCGAPGVGTLNYNPAIPCGRPGSNNCANPQQYINWDGIHFTEAFNRVISKFALNGNFTDNGVNYAKVCDLDFSKFGSSVTYNQVYPFECDTLFT